MHSIKKHYSLKENNTIYLITEIENKDIITLTTVEAYNLKKHKVATYKHFGSVLSFLNTKNLNKKHLTLVYEELTFKQVNLENKKVLGELKGLTFVSQD